METLTITATAATLKVGVNFIVIKGQRFLIYKGQDGSLSACKNVCSHNGGVFVRDIEDIGSPSVVKCSFHGWKLDCATMTYTNPPDCLEQEQMIIEPLSDGSLILTSPIKTKPWALGTVFPRVELTADEVTITYLSHACVEIKLGCKTILTDPWLTGPAFGRGWWLLHEPPSDAWSKLAKADAIYISHSHPDHCNIPTLSRLYDINPLVNIYVAELSIPILKADFYKIGFENIHVVKSCEWVQLSLNARFMILPDSLYPHLDTCLLAEYKGYTILNLVDCCFPNHGILPDSIDVLLTDFASGASGFPSCFVDQFGFGATLEKAKEKASVFLKKVIKHAALTKAKVWIPFAGYFTEAHPSDYQTKALNWKNSASNAAEMVMDRIKGIQTWLPFPGGSFDVCKMKGDAPSMPAEYYLKKDWDFETYINEFQYSLNFSALQNISGVAFYFKWLGFYGYNLQLHVVEMDDDFVEIIREFYVDFSGREVLVGVERNFSLPYLRVKARATVIRDIMIKGLSWDNIYIGFSGRFFAEPDVYHFKFWDYLNNKTPPFPPPWDDCKSTLSNPATNLTSHFYRDIFSALFFALVAYGFWRYSCAFRGSFL